MQKYLHPSKLKLISKGIDSVKSRVLNLNEKFPNINKDLIYNVIEEEWINYHGIKDYEKKYIEDENSNHIAKIKELYNYYNSWKWKFGESPEFTNTLSYKFDWGLVDLSLKVEKGIIEEAVLYSDTLLMNFVEVVNEDLKKMKGQYSYDKKGVFNLLEGLKSSFMSENIEYKKYIQDMQEQLISQI
jgi:lipoate-protein ligase A